MSWCRDFVGSIIFGTSFGASLDRWSSRAILSLVGLMILASYFGPRKFDGPHNRFGSSEVGEFRPFWASWIRWSSWSVWVPMRLMSSRASLAHEVDKFSTWFWDCNSLSSQQRLFFFIQVCARKKYILTLFLIMLTQVSHGLSYGTSSSWLPYLLEYKTIAYFVRHRYPLYGSKYSKA